MGFFDSLGAGISSVWKQIAPSLGTLSGQVLGSLAVRGAGELGDLVFGKQTAAGSPQSGINAQFARFGLGTPQMQFSGNRPLNQLTGIPLGTSGGGSAASAAVNAWLRANPGAINPFTPQRGTQFGARQQNISGLTPFDQFGGGVNPVAFPTTRNAGFQQALFDFQIGGSPLLQLPGGGGGGVSQQMFRPTMAGASAQTFMTQNPVTGRDTWFRPAGRPILWSGDLACARRVTKIARRAGRKR